MQSERRTPLTPSAAVSSAEQGPLARARARRLTLLLLALATCVVALDQTSKAWAQARLSPGEVVPVLGQLLQLRLVYNSGAAFGLASGMTIVFPLVALIVVVVIARSASRLANSAWAVALGLLLGGAVGNLCDRLLRPPSVGRGHVVDFLALPHWPVFNVADMAIVSSACLIVLLSVMGRSLDGSHHG